MLGWHIGRVDVHLQSFLTSTLDTGEWLSSKRASFPPAIVLLQSIKLLVFIIEKGCLLRSVKWIFKYISGPFSTFKCQLRYRHKRGIATFLFDLRGQFDAPVSLLLQNIVCYPLGRILGKSQRKYECFGEEKKSVFLPRNEPPYHGHSVHPGPYADSAITFPEDSTAYTLQSYVEFIELIWISRVSTQRLTNSQHRPLWTHTARDE